jgi:flagellar hook-associated protein 2
MVTGLDTQISSWDARLTMKERSLQRQFTALETALSKAKSQGNWMAAQL